MRTSFISALGYMAFSVESDEIVALAFGYDSASAALHSLAKLEQRSDRRASTAASDTRHLAEQLEDRLLRFAEGEPVDFDEMNVSHTGMTDFQKRVITACRAIPWGETATYGELAESVGHPGAARAVGTVMANNRVPLVVPCHRVLASGGQLGGYSARQGIAMKKRLLEAEQAALFKSC